MGTLRIPRAVAGLLAGSLRVGGKALQLLARAVEDVAGLDSGTGTKSSGTVAGRGEGTRRGAEGTARAAEGTRRGAEGTARAAEGTRRTPSTPGVEDIDGERGGGRHAASSAHLNGVPVVRDDEPTYPPPLHVEDEVALAGQSVDPGAQAGAELHIAEPWEGYQAMRAPDVVNRLGVESEEALAVVLLYEQSTKRRRTVLAAVERELARRSAAG